MIFTQNTNWANGCEYPPQVTNIFLEFHCSHKIDRKGLIFLTKANFENWTIKSNQIATYGQTSVKRPLKLNRPYYSSTLCQKQFNDNLFSIYQTNKNYQKCNRNTRREHF
jgi:hypothetical protein